MRDEDIKKMTTQNLALKLKELMDQNGSTPSSDLNEQYKEISRGSSLPDLVLIGSDGIEDPELEGDEDIEIVPEDDLDEDKDELEESEE